MKLKYDFVISDMGDELVAVPVGDGAAKFHGMLRLNQSAAEILELLKEETTPEAVHKTLMERYPDSDINEVGKALEGVLNQLVREGVLQPN